MQWNSDTSAALKKMSANLPVDFGVYSKALQKHANELMDHKVANTDMTLRHIVSHFIRVSEGGRSSHCSRHYNNWRIVTFVAASEEGAETSDDATSWCSLGLIICGLFGRPNIIIGPHIIWLIIIWSPYFQTHYYLGLILPKYYDLFKVLVMTYSHYMSRSWILER